MKWTYAIPQKMKTAVLLFCVMASGFLFNLIERNNVARMKSFVTSINNDRLVPATVIFHLTDNLYGKHFAMNKFLATEANDVARVKAELASHDKIIAGLISEFEQTYIVEDEAVFLNEFKINAQRHMQMEQQIVALSENNRKADGKALFEAKGKQSLDATIGHLSELIEVQTKVSGQLLDDTKGVLAISNLLSGLQLVLILVIGKMIFSLVSASKIMRPRSRNSHLN